ncbi:hypothetical protein GALMADRAFT_155541 [Galerina marginata CBS 339.88]|uniref:Heterokaryon incompatibility domain-containing protein n=1 Tax=Galerina marginata (strain CBS 339.88) TaxID=685588 RepID=A0A067T3K8_GALM3|nr:hypothetical protein GALMADRAFT_155541 [Galerina marginata CBS 339.88]
MMSDQARIPAPLCDVCQKLELWKTNDRENGEYDLGTWEHVKRKAKKGRSRCPGCIAWRFIGDDSGKAIVVWGDSGGFYYDTGSTVKFLNEETAKSPIGSARVVQPHIDPALIKKWVKLCETGHQNTCTPIDSIIGSSEGDLGMKVFRVVDVEEWCIVESKPGIRYLALSYIWGGVVPPFRLQRHNLTELSTKGALVGLREGLPKTMRDAFDLVQLIGERYLWVDLLCLIQDDDSDMLHGISHMDLVYKCAMLTIVAASGEDANAGLPGLHPGSREVNQKTIEILPGVKMCRSDMFSYHLVGLRYLNRAWTFQELVLSRRTLIFTNDRIFFRCRTNCWGEDLVYDNFPSVINEFLGTDDQIDFIPDDQVPPLLLYELALLGYQGRELTKESDRIHAFTGVIHLLSTEMRTGTLEGLLTASIDISLIFWSDYSPYRRETFPSWSWAGWRAQFNGYGRYFDSPEDANSWLQTMTYIVWYKRNPETLKLELVWGLHSQLEHGKPETHHIGYRPTLDDPYGRTIDKHLKNLRTKPDDDLDGYRAPIIHEEMSKRKYHFLHFFAHVVTSSRFGEWVSDWSARSLLGKHNKSCGHIQIEDDTPKEVPGPHELVLLSKMPTDKIVELSKTKIYTPFFFHAVQSGRPFYWVMYIVWLGGKKVVAERKGLGWIYEDCIGDLPRGGKKIWKEIILV